MKNRSWPFAATERPRIFSASVAGGVRPEAAERRAAGGEAPPPLGLAQVECAVVEARVHVRPDLVDDAEREGRRRGAEGLEGGGEELPSVPRLRVRLQHPP